VEQKCYNLHLKGMTMKFDEQLDIYLRSRFTLVSIITTEEERAVQSIRGLCERTQRSAISWDMADGFQWVTAGLGSLPNAKDPLTALEQIEKTDANANTVFILKDFHDALENPQVRRKLRSASQRLKFTKKTILLTSPITKTPIELSDELVNLEFPLPDADDLREILQKFTQTKGMRVNLTPLGQEKMVQAALGLTSAQANRVFSKAIVSDGVLDDKAIDLVTEEKKEIIRESEALEFFPYIELPDDVGGLDVLKGWLQLREQAFSQEARAYGLPVPKGIALLGIPGTGKSLSAKMIAGLWRQPLIRLDVGSLFGSLVGESEERARRALRLVETIAPCILWIDEIEKALAHGGLDSGTSTRVFASILTWMQEKKSPVFVVATANDITSLPPELLRKGRFDEIFFLDLPTEEERAQIFAVHLRKKNRFPEDFDILKLARASEGYVGSEIEQAIIDAMYLGFNDRLREFTTADILTALERQVPLSVSQKENIEALRTWLHEGRAQSASFKEALEAENRFVSIKPNKSQGV
jgi:SpoVK/Ycf46/Vps4 family AAA+-type ATPase